ncbi:MAG: VacJ family lipoprotein [Pseudomonadota bacterium]|nr:VacJ family lipoprotein [Pseudomonadota bacterium]
MSCSTAAANVGKDNSLSIIPFDPFEKYNRRIHSLNKSADTLTLRPASQIYGTSVPQAIRLSASNFYGNLQEPKRFTNHILQREFSKASNDISRFVLNSSVGLLGLFDVASLINLFPEETNFDETFAYFDIPAGPYFEIPLFGPSSLRGSIGLLTDYSFNPLLILSGQLSNVSFVTFEILNIVNERYEYSHIFDSLLYDSSDSYSSTRLTYIQKDVSISSKKGYPTSELFDPTENY